MDEEYNLEKSKSKVGELYPRIRAADGELIDGNQRGEEWREEILPWIDTEEKKLLARAIANWHRRPISREEKEKWINDLARLYKQQGFRIRGDNPRGTPPNEIVDKITIETGLARNTVLEYLHNEFKQMERATAPSKPIIPASQRIETELGPEYVERHREEIKRELRKDPNFMEEVRRIIPEKDDVKKQREISERGKKIGKEISEGLTELKAKVREAKPKQRLLAAISHLSLIEKLLQEGKIFCPNCEGKPGSDLLAWDCCGDSLADSIKILREKLNE